MSFILRTVLPDGYETNRIIGSQYSYVNRETHYEEFCRSYKVVFGIDHVTDLDVMSDQFAKNCYGIIVYNNGADLIPLYKKQISYIMTENGKTFSNVTFK